MKPRQTLKNPRMLPAPLQAPRRPRLVQVRPGRTSVFNVTLRSFTCWTRGGRCCGGYRGARGHGGAGWGENEDVRWGRLRFTSSVSRPSSLTAPCERSAGHSRTGSDSIRGDVVPGQLHSAQQIHLFWQRQKYVCRKKLNKKKERKKWWITACVQSLPTTLTSSTEKNKSYVISSFVETKGESMIAKSAVEFVEYPLKLKTWGQK